MSEALVLIPGFMSDGRVYCDQVSELSRDRAVMVAPLLGASVEAMAEAILTSAPAKFALAGHDLGASVAAEILRRAPERITRIALICASAQAEPPNAAAAREPRMIKAKTGRFGEAILEELPSTTLIESPHRNAIRDHWVDMAMAGGVERYIEQSKLMQRRPDLQNVLRRARLPALVVGGVGDTICPPRRQDFIAQLMPLAKLHILENAGHLPMLEAPQSLNRVMQEWLAVSAPLLLK